MIRLLVLVPLLAASPLAAATPDSYAALDNATRAACAKASGFTNAYVHKAPIRFSDVAGKDARLVVGTYPQPHMKGAQGLMLCLYDRATKRVEVQDADAWWARRTP